MPGTTPPAGEGGDGGTGGNSGGSQPEGSGTEVVSFRRTAVGGGNLPEAELEGFGSRNWLVSGRTQEMKITSDVLYGRLSSKRWALYTGERSPVVVQLIYVVNSSVRSISEWYSEHVYYHKDVNYSDDGIGRYVYNIALPGRTDDEIKGNSFSIFSLVVNPYPDAMVAPRVTWTIRTSRGANPDHPSYPVPIYYEDGLLGYPWLSSSRVERDDEYEGPSSGAMNEADPGDALTAVSGPATGSYKLNWRFEGDNRFYYQLRGERFSASPTVGYKGQWAFTRLSSYSNKCTLSQTFKGFGFGYLSITDAGVRLVTDETVLEFVVTSSGIALRSVAGWYICWANTPDAGYYEDYSVSYIPGVTKDLSLARSFYLDTNP